MNQRRSELSELPNLGSTITTRLRAVGVSSPGALARIGAPAVYARLCRAAERRLPRCYYPTRSKVRFGAFTGRDLCAEDKRQLERAVCELTRSPRPRALFARRIKTL